jgi:hypothetical protein
MFQSRITDQNFMRRCAYRTLLAGRISTLCVLDGIEITLTEKENGYFLSKKSEAYKKVTDISISDHTLSMNVNREHGVKSLCISVNSQVCI